MSSNVRFPYRTHITHYMKAIITRGFVSTYLKVSLDLQPCIVIVASIKYALRGCKPWNVIFDWARRCGRMTGCVDLSDLSLTSPVTFCSAYNPLSLVCWAVGEKLVRRYDECKVFSVTQGSTHGLQVGYWQGLLYMCLSVTCNWGCSQGTTKRDEWSTTREVLSRHFINSVLSISLICQAVM